MLKYTLAVWVLAAVIVGSDTAGEWGYEDSGETWPGTCSTGTHQSPIDIVHPKSASSTDTQYLPIQISYEATTSFSILDEGHNYKISGSFGQLKAENFDLTGVYKFDSAQFHFHAPSEHTIDEHHYPLEMHIVHTISNTTSDNPLSLAVLGVLFEEGYNNPMLANFISDDVSSISLYDLFSGRKQITNYYMYKGSLTTPPCTESVNWYVWADVQEASKEQIEFFNKKWEENEHFAEGKGNNRIIQPLNDREVIHFKDLAEYLSLAGLAFFLTY